MRMLFTTLQLAGHFQPLVPVAQAAADAGHEVVFACAHSFVPTVERRGFRAFSAGFDHRGRPTPELFPGFLKVPGDRAWSWGPPRIHVDVYAVAMAPDLLTIAREWRPDLIVRDSSEYGGCVIAEALGLPHATVRTGSTSSRYSIRDLFSEPLARLRELNGLPPDPDTVMPFRYLHLAAEPLGFGLPDEIPAPTTHYLRSVEADHSGDETLPPWVAALPDRPTVHTSLGTLAHRTPGVNEAIIAALRDEPINLISVVGRDQDPGRFGPQPESVHIERYLPHSALLPHCDAFVTHGGYGSVMVGLNNGLPLVVIPIQADQPYNAACCAALGVGRVIAPDDRTPEAIRAAVRAVLGDPTYRANAERVRDAMATLPGPEHAVALLERLAKEKQPVLSHSG
jgi:UDP:flavonoid glycosyltransferase YjiC (YdhE family)